MLKETQVETAASSSEADVLSSWWSPEDRMPGLDDLVLATEAPVTTANVQENDPAVAPVEAAAPSPSDLSQPIAQSLPADAAAWARPREFSNRAPESPFQRDAIGHRSLATTVQGLAQTKSPFMQLHDIVQPEHISSQHLRTIRANDGLTLLDKFSRPDCLMDMNIAPDGTVSALLTAGCRAYKRTIVCRPDGTFSQRVTGPGGQEIVRLRSDAQGIQSIDPLRGIKTRLNPLA